MVRLGKVYGNSMVDVAVTNTKLEDRALRILSSLAGLDREQGLLLLEQGGGSVKVALLMSAAQLPATSAVALLEKAQGNLRLALEVNGFQLHGPQ